MVKVGGETKNTTSLGLVLEVLVHDDITGNNDFNRLLFEPQYSRDEGKVAADHQSGPIPKVGLVLDQ